MALRAACLALSLALVLTSLPAHAATPWSAGDGSPQQYRYNVSQPGSAGTLGSTGHVVPGSCSLGSPDCLTTGTLRDDEVSTCIAPAAKVPFYGTGRSCIYVGANGFVAFAPAGALATAHPVRLPVGGGPDMIAAFWADLVPSACATGGVYFRVDPTQVFVEWRSVPIKPSNGPVLCGVTPTVSVLLAIDTTGYIQLGVSPSNPSATFGSASPVSIGVQGGAFGLAVAYQSPPETYPASSMTISPNRAPFVSVSAYYAPVKEDKPYTFYAYAGDPEGDTYTTTVTVSAGTATNIQPSGAYYPTVTYTPDPDFNGPVTLTATATDSLGATSKVSYTFTVAAVNDAPVLSLQGDLLVHHNGPTHTYASFASATPGPATATDEARQNVTLSVSTDHPELFRDAPSLSSDGTLQFRAGASAGTAIVTVTAHDDGGTANAGVDTTTGTFSITIE